MTESGAIPEPAPKTIHMYSIYYCVGVELFGVLDPQGFDAIGHGFETPEEAQQIANQLNLETL